MANQHEDWFYRPQDPKEPGYRARAHNNSPRISYCSWEGERVTLEDHLRTHKKLARRRSKLLFLGTVLASLLLVGIASWMSFHG